MIETYPWEHYYNYASFLSRARENRIKYERELEEKFQTLLKEGRIKRERTI